MIEKYLTGKIKRPEMESYIMNLELRPDGKKQ
jgi:hypothetical protein